MIEHGELIARVDGYRQRCQQEHRKPSKNGLALVLEVATGTIQNVVRGEYRNGSPYTEKPHPRRRIDNADFDRIRALFDMGGEI